MRTALATFLLALSSLAGEALDRLVPDTTVFYVSLENVARSRERFAESRLAALWADPAVQAFAAKAVAGWTEWNEKSRKEEGWSLEDVLGVMDGTVALAITRFEKEGNDVQGVILAEVGANGDKVKEMIGTVEKTLIEGEGMRREEEEFRGVTIVSYRSAEEEEGGDRDCWLLDGGTFAYASRPDVLREMLARRESGEEGTLAAHEPYRRARARTGERSDLVFYVGASALVASLKAEGGPLGGEEDAKIFDALGLGAVDAACVQVAFESTGLAMRLFVSVPGEKEGVLKLFAAPNSALLPPAFVGDDVTSVATLALDLPGLWEEVRRVGNKIEPSFGATMDAGLETIKGALGVDLQKDFIGALGKQVTWYARDVEGEPGVSVSFLPIPQIVLAIEVAEQQKIEMVVQAILGQLQGMVQTEDYLGVKLHQVMLPMPISPAFALLPGQLVLAVRGDDVKDAIRRLGKDVKGLRDSPEFARGVEGAPEGRIYLGFSRDAKALRDSAFLTALGRSREMRQLFDPALFPAESVLEKYLDVSCGTIVNAEDGILLTNHARFKPAPEDGER
jgi:hypothetical protein